MNVWRDKLHSSEVSGEADLVGLVSSIGNLTLLDGNLNKQASFRPFIEKKPRYDKSNYIITRDLTKIEDWTVEHINARSEWLIAMFDEIFQVDEPSAVLPFTEWYEMQHRRH
jgi:hypothetical protein